MNEKKLHLKFAANLSNKTGPLLFEGAKLTRKGVAETIAGEHMTPVRELFPMVLEAEPPMFVCSACIKKYNIPEEEIVAGIKIATLPTVTAEMTERETIMF